MEEKRKKAKQIVMKALNELREFCEKECKKGRQECMIFI